MTEKEKLKVQLLTAQGAFTRLELGIGDLVYEVEEEEINVPGPKLRFSLFSYGEEDDDNKEEEKTEKEKEEDAAFDAFMADIAKL